MRIAVIGLGNAGATLHLPALAGLSDVQVVGGMDIDAERRTGAAARFGIPTFSDFDELVRVAKPEVVIIGTPPGSHAEYCLRSFAAGAHVICEKPFVSSLAEADQVIASARAAGRRIALNHEFREMPIFRAVRDAVDSNATGELVLAQVWQLMDLPPWAEPGWRGQMLQRTLYEAGFPVSVARHRGLEEDVLSVDGTFRDMLVANGLPADTPIVSFPEFLRPFSEGRTPAITEDCMTQYQSAGSRAAFMCAYTKMVVKKDGRMRVYACTLVDDDEDYDLGGTLSESMAARVMLRHHRCFSCFAYGACCSDPGSKVNME